MINLLYCGNDNVFKGLLTSLLSIIKNTSDELNVYCFTMDLQDVNPKYKPILQKDVSILENVIKTKNPKSKIILIDLSEMFRKEMIDSKNAQSQYTPYCLLRLFASKVDLIPDKILYLDTDTMACSDISKLFNIDIEKYEYASVRDYYGKFFFYPNYCNSGVLLLNMKKIRQTGLFDKSRDLLNKKKIFLPDQTAINKLTTKRLILNRKFNEQKRINKNTIIRHFCMSMRFLPYFKTINVKQWDIEKMHTILNCHEFDDILEQYEKIMKEKVS